MDRQLELVITGNDPVAARALAASHGGTVYVDERDGADVPFRTLVRLVTDDAEALSSIPSEGTYVVVARTVKARPGAPAPEGVVALFPMIRHPDLRHAQSDAHWRDNHAPLALRHHVAMSHYTQLSVVHTISGFPYDGFALCGFDSSADMRERFFDGPEGRAAITADVAKFADTTRSPRRLVTTEG